MADCIVDSNLLVYLVDDTEKEKHSKALNWLESNSEGLKQAGVLLQNLREFSAVLHKKKARVEQGKINLWISIFSRRFEVLDEKPEDTIKANELTEKFKTDFWDAFIAASMERLGIMAIYTENTKDFDKIKTGIKAVNPFEINH